MENSKINFILASASPRRKELIGHLGMPFKILTQNIEEKSDAKIPADFARDIASDKGLAVFDELCSSKTGLNYFVVSADTIVSLENRIYGKPQNVTEARKFLYELSGKEHSVFTAVHGRLIYQNNMSEFSFVEESKVTFATITHELMENYLATQDSLDKAGAYGIQGPSLTFISKVNGCYSNVVGFPLSRFVSETSNFFHQKFPQEASWLNLFHS